MKTINPTSVASPSRGTGECPSALFANWNNAPSSRPVDETRLCVVAVSFYRFFLVSTGFCIHSDRSFSHRKT